MANFGNVRAVQTLLANARARRQERLQATGGRHSDPFTVGDVDPDLEDQDPVAALAELAQYETVAEQLRELGLMVAQRRREGRPLDGLVNHYVFSGPPGTGKTSVARLIGRVLYSYGILARKDAVETSSANLIGAYVGHTRKAVQEAMEAARGGVLFVDEAYELGRGAFGADG